MDSMKRKFINRFCNDHNGTVRWLRSVAMDEEHLLEQILEFFDAVEKSLSVRFLTLYEISCDHWSALVSAPNGALALDELCKRMVVPKNTLIEKVGFLDKSWKTEVVCVRIKKIETPS